MAKRNAVRVEGLKELEHALRELPKATARNTLKGVLKKRAEPIAAAARSLVRVKSGRLRDSIVVSPKISNATGKAEFAAALRAGKGKAAAVSALRDARRAAGGSSYFAEMHVGPGPLPHAHLNEFGSSKMSPKPFMRPAWDSNKGAVLDGIKADLWAAIGKAAARYRKRLAKKKLAAL